MNGQYQYLMQKLILTHDACASYTHEVTWMRKLIYHIQFNFQSVSVSVLRRLTDSRGGTEDGLIY